MIRQDYARWLERGREHQQAGRPIDAMVCYRRALASNQHSVEAQYRVAQVLRDLGRHREARAALLAGLAMNPQDGRLLLGVAGAARRAGDHAEAIDACRRVLASNPEDVRARAALALSRIAQGNESAFAELWAVLGNGAAYRRWDELATTLAAAAPSAARSAFLLELATSRVSEFPPLLLALTAEEMIASGTVDRARDVLARAEPLAEAIGDPEILRRLALAEAASGGAKSWAERYAQRCVEQIAPAPPVAWPRRTAGKPIRIAYLIEPGMPVVVDGVSIEPGTYLLAVTAAHSRERFAATVYAIGDAGTDALADMPAADVRLEKLPAGADAAAARKVAESDPDVLVDLVGMRAPLGLLLARHPARTQWTYPGLAAAQVAPLITHALPAPAAADERALAQHRLALEAAVHNICTAQPWFSAASVCAAAELTAAWRRAVAAHKAG